MFYFQNLFLATAESATHLLLEPIFGQTKPSEPHLEVVSSVSVKQIGEPVPVSKKFCSTNGQFPETEISFGKTNTPFMKIMSRTDFSDQFRKIIIHLKRIGYDLKIMRHSACLVINPISVDNFAALFNCTSVDRASDSMMAPT